MKIEQVQLKRVLKRIRLLQGNACRLTHLLSWNISAVKGYVCCHEISVLSRVTYVVMKYQYISYSVYINKLGYGCVRWTDVVYMSLILVKQKPVWMDAVKIGEPSIKNSSKPDPCSFLLPNVTEINTNMCYVFENYMYMYSLPEMKGLFSKVVAYDKKMANLDFLCTHDTLQSCIEFISETFTATHGAPSQMGNSWYFSWKSCKRRWGTVVSIRTTWGRCMSSVFTVCMVIQTRRAKPGTCRITMCPPSPSPWIRPSSYLNTSSRRICQSLTVLKQTQCQPRCVLQIQVLYIRESMESLVYMYMFTKIRNLSKFFSKT